MATVGEEKTLLPFFHDIKEVYNMENGIEKFNFKNKLLMGITLFSMFFGAGNLIFPPFLGAQAGTHTWPAFLGFAASAVGLPVLGVVAVTLSGGLDKLASRVHPKFAFGYTVLLYLAIGPCLAIPRTASTSFSITVQPFMPKEVPLGAVQLIYSLIFFGLAALVALHPERLTDFLGRWMSPILLTLIVCVFAGTLIKSPGEAAAPAEAYQNMAPVQGFLDGYQTMDTLAALNFGLIVAVNIRAKGITEEKSVMNETICAGWIAGIILAAVYGALTFIGMHAGGRFSDAENGTEVLTAAAQFLCGKTGMIIMAACFFIACFNTCVGLLSCCGKYFNSICPRFSHRTWVWGFAAVSVLIANIGLNAILKFSVPVLNAIYPLAILLIVLAFLHRWLKYFPYVYPFAAGFCGISSILIVLEQQHIFGEKISRIFHQVPGYTAGFGWVIPTLAGIVIGILAGAGMLRRR